jgi:hypothetical protein
MIVAMLLRGAASATARRFSRDRLAEQNVKDFDRAAAGAAFARVHGHIPLSARCERHDGGVGGGACVSPPGVRAPRKV